MTAKYDRDGISFQYPDNWAFEEDPKTGFPRTVSVTSEDGAFWSATLYLQDQPLKQLQHQYIETLEQEYEEVEIDDVEFPLGDETIRATDLQFYCLDFLVHSRLIATQVGRHQALIAWQAEDRDFDKLEPVFQAITFSLFQGAPASSRAASEK
jgi:hypothetical protein